MKTLVWKFRPLGESGLNVSPLGVGTNRWNYGKNDLAVFETYKTLLEGGINFIDTAEMYGMGKSESLIGECIRRYPRPVVVASKFMPFIARTSSKSLLSALDATLNRLGIETIDLYYIHFPAGRIKTLSEGLVEAVKSGKTRHVGVSNFNVKQMRKMAGFLDRAGIHLAANEVHYNLLNRKVESNGVLDTCRELGVALVAYFPLASGKLTSAPDNNKKNALGRLQQTLAGIAARHQVSPGQVALNWLLSRAGHVIPIPGSSKVHHVQDNISALTWKLSDEEFSEIDKASSCWL